MVNSLWLQIYYVSTHLEPTTTDMATWTYVDRLSLSLSSAMATVCMHTCTHCTHWTQISWHIAHRHFQQNSLMQIQIFVMNIVEQLIQKKTHSGWKSSLNTLVTVIKPLKFIKALYFTPRKGIFRPLLQDLCKILAYLVTLEYVCIEVKGVSTLQFTAIDTGNSSGCSTCSFKLILLICYIQTIGNQRLSLETYCLVWQDQRLFSIEIEWICGLKKTNFQHRFEIHDSNFEWNVSWIIW